jgi:Tol biopolymer transport system component
MKNIFYCILFPTSILWGADGISKGNKPSFSPDGKTILYEHEDKIKLYDLSSKEETILCDFTKAANPRWSPDGKKIIFQGTKKDKALTVSSIWIVNKDGRDYYEVFKSKTTNCNPCFSKDGRSIAWNQGSKVFIADADGKNIRLLNKINLSGENIVQDWSRENKSIIFLNISKPYQSKIWFSDTSGANLKSLTVDLYIRSARWYKDTSHLAILTSYGVVKLNIDTTYDQYLLYSNNSIGFYDFSNDLQFIVFELIDPEFDNDIMIDKLYSTEE